MNEYQKSGRNFLYGKGGNITFAILIERGISSVTIALPADGGVQEVTEKIMK